MITNWQQYTSLFSRVIAHIPTHGVHLHMHQSSLKKWQSSSILLSSRPQNLVHYMWSLVLEGQKPRAMWLRKEKKKRKSNVIQIKFYYDMKKRKTRYDGFTNIKKSSKLQDVGLFICFGLWPLPSHDRMRKLIEVHLVYSPHFKEPDIWNLDYSNIMFYEFPSTY